MIQSVSKAELLIQSSQTEPLKYLLLSAYLPSPPDFDCLNMTKRKSLIGSFDYWGINTTEST
ncbi:MAG: hypothetical protein NT007_00175 [Candidatus Kapabacteria bacterium]|nr:hypothetical protein [Candidatus Kapabacteria bacterium]